MGAQEEDLELRRTSGWCVGVVGSSGAYCVLLFLHRPVWAAVGRGSS